MNWWRQLFIHMTKQNIPFSVQKILISERSARNVFDTQANPITSRIHNEDHNAELDPQFVFEANRNRKNQKSAEKGYWYYFIKINSPGSQRRDRWSYLHVRDGDTSHPARRLLSSWERWTDRRLLSRAVASELVGARVNQLHMIHRLNRLGMDQKSRVVWRAKDMFRNRTIAMCACKLYNVGGV